MRMSRMAMRASGCALKRNSRPDRRSRTIAAVVVVDLLVLAAVFRGGHALRFLRGEPNGDERLVAAAMVGNADEAGRALEDGASPNASGDAIEETALMFAASSGDAPTVVRLLDAGADLSTTTSKGQTALKAAVSRGHAEIVKLLLARGADVNQRSRVGETPLMRAASQGNEEIAALLLAHGADPTLALNDGWTPLDACDRAGGNTRLAMRLRAARARPGAPHPVPIETAPGTQAVAGGK